jgi:hypothetical protein
LIYVFVDCNWIDTRWQQYSTHSVDTRWQQYFTHLHTISTQNNTMKQNTQNITYITIRIHKHNNKIHNLHNKQKHTRHITLPSN